MALLIQPVTSHSSYQWQENANENISGGYSEAISELYCFDLRYTRTVLEEVYNEAYEVSREDSELEPISTQAHSEAITLLTAIHEYLPMPDIMWLEDGGVGFEWRKGSDKIFTMSVYGDETIIYGGILGKNNKISGIVPLTDKLTFLVLTHLIDRHFNTVI
ncbi:hypothetical protein IH992_30225 [Candidatus Poribacteria bacterium]|nr:hypothetical protein [Candidatus Poribacteria bacterium]